jgi:hypothetical protein
MGIIRQKLLAEQKNESLGSLPVPAFRLSSPGIPSGYEQLGGLTIIFRTLQGKGTETFGTLPIIVVLAVATLL